VKLLGGEGIVVVTGRQDDQDAGLRLFVDGAWERTGAMPLMNALSVELLAVEAWKLGSFSARYM